MVDDTTDKNDFLLDDDTTDDNNETKETTIDLENKSIFSRKFVIIFGVILVGVLLISTILFFTSMPAKKSTTTSLMKTTVPNVNTAPIVKAKYKKKKKIKYVKLYTQLNSDQVTSIMRELSFEGIAFDIVQKGKFFNVLVDKDLLSEAQTLLAMKGLPGTKAKGYEIFDDAQNLGVTEFDKRIRYIRAISGELEKAIRQFDSIETSKVQVVLPEEKLFSVTQPPVTASILVRNVAGLIITDETVYAIIQLVTNAVENLQPENISVVDTKGNVLSIGIFERIAKKKRQAATQEKEKKQTEEKANKALRTKELVQKEEPKPKSISYAELKEQQEQNLRNKAIAQLNTILPENSFRISLNLELNSLDELIPDIKQMTISIVVDKKTKLTSKLKTKIFNVLVGVTSYQKGRDVIKLIKSEIDLIVQADKKEAKKSAEEAALLAKKRDAEETAKITLAKKQAEEKKRWLNYLTWGGGSALIVGLFMLIRKLFKAKKTAPMSAASSSQALEKQKTEADFSSIQKEMNTEKVKELAYEKPGILAQVLTDWLEEDKKNTEDEVPS
jgi:flagellar biosynthesis/type III secretory pathway M-ring protein FliF/YscJ